MRELKLSKLVKLALVPVFAAGVATTPQAQTSDKPSGSNAAQSQPAANYRGVRASQMIGMSVVNEKGNNIGQIGDMIVNMNTGDVRYAILRFDPGIFEGEKLFAVPTTELRMAADRNDVLYKMSQERLEKAAVDKADWNDALLNDPNYLANLDKVWGVTQPSRGALAHRASDLIGKDVNSKSGEDIGEIEELVINMAEQKVHYAVLEFDPSWASAEQNYAFPLTAFNLTDNRDELVLDIDKSQLQAMKSFPDSRWNNLNDRTWIADIDRYLVIFPVAADAGKTGHAGRSGPTGATTTAAAPSPGTLFDRLDADRDGFLDQGEAKADAGVTAAWGNMDKNDKGQVSRDDFTNTYKMEATQ